MSTNIRLDKRKELVLSQLINMFIDECTPISSSHVVTHMHLKVSSATVRNEMAELEQEGFIFQPHSSSGRIPTVKGYRYYVEYLLESPIIRNQDIESLVLHTGNDLRQIAKEVAQRTENAVFFTQDQPSTFYTGISNLLRKPEFFQKDILEHIGQVVDQIDDIVLNVSRTMNQKEQMIVGDEDLFGQECSAVIVQLGNKSIFGILGPTRMHYDDALRYARIVQSINQMM